MATITVGNFNITLSKIMYFISLVIIILMLIPGLIHISELWPLGFFVAGHLVD